jgi:exodeoxyribonuclease VII large subunit
MSTKSNKDNDILSVTQLTDFIKKNLPDKKIKVTGEISQPKLSSGHLYFSIKDDFANIKSIIWKSKSNINRENIIEGQKFTVEGKLDFYGGSSNINLIVDKVISTDGNGELFLKYEKIKQEFISKGYFDKSNKKTIGPIIKNILVITSENGAALQDFIFNLLNHKSCVKWEVLDVKVQGNDCPKNICQQLENLKKLNKYYDLVVITRGGGSFEELFGFSQPELIQSVFDFHLPVLSAIGHQVDNPLLDLVADYSAPTPSLAAQFIIDHNKKYVDSLEHILNNVKNELLEHLTEQQTFLTKLNEKIYKSFNKITKIKSECENSIRQEIGNLLVNLSILESKIKLNQNPNIILVRNKTNEIIKTSEELNCLVKNEIIKLRWGNSEYRLRFLE